MALVDLPGHNISPPIEKQLVLELKVREELMEGHHGFPSSFIVRESFPLDQNVPDSAAELTAHGLDRLLQ